MKHLVKSNNNEAVLDVIETVLREAGVESKDVPQERGK